jgi:hypothetical protein
MEIDDPILQSGFILLPRHTVYAGRSLTLKRVEAVPEKINVQVVEQGGDSSLTFQSSERTFRLTLDDRFLSYTDYLQITCHFTSCAVQMSTTGHL